MAGHKAIAPAFVRGANDKHPPRDIGILHQKLGLSGKARVVIDNHASNNYTVLEVNGRDRPGLLHDVTAAMSEQGLQIASAHVTTYGVRAVDVFYVKDVFGLKIENERKLAALRDALLRALAPSDEAAPVPVPKVVKRRRPADAA